MSRSGDGLLELGQYSTQSKIRCSKSRRSARERAFRQVIFVGL